MEHAQAALEALAALIEEARAASPRALWAAWGAGVASTLLFLVALAAARFHFASSGVRNPQGLKPALSGEDGVIRFSAATIARLGLSKTANQRVIVTALRPRGKGYARLASTIENLGWRSDANLKPDTVEISERSYARLFRSRPPSEDGVIHLDVRPYRLTGFADYWMNPEPRTRFANRFAVYLTVFVFAVQLMIDRTG